MKKTNGIMKNFGDKKPRKTKKNALIRRAVKRAVHDYKEAYQRLAYE
ncbi:hypothetical protein HY502_00450 [Candidatus Woesebacteria bacterium]|nr:hypothetical protein [Candidatus Woesebacteria bacterium]